ncbi:MAG TPA: hypothetical protein VJP79_12415 [Nitrososphaera sp.]|nr:hypothetical protein [Nitrososphaera sp.]
MIASRGSSLFSMKGARVFLNIRSDIHPLLFLFQTIKGYHLDYSMGGIFHVKVHDLSE